MTAAGDAALVLATFRAALLKESAAVSRQALAWYDGVDISKSIAGARLADRLAPQFKRSAELGIAFYRLYAALLSGRTVDHPLRRGRQKRVSFSELVADFEAASGVKLTGLTTFSRRTFRVDPGLDAVSVQRTFDSNRAEAQRAFAKRWEKRVNAAGAEAAAAEGDREWYAGVAQQIVANGARDSMAVVGNADSKLIGWVRVSGTGSPCSFCAMLISKGIGFMPYRSKASAGGSRDYHPHCKCYPVPVFSKADWKSNLTFKQNREMESEWTEFRGGGGRSLKEWRSYYDKKFGVKKVGGRRERNAS